MPLLSRNETLLAKLKPLLNHKLWLTVDRFEQYWAVVGETTPLCDNQMDYAEFDSKDQHLVHLNKGDVRNEGSFQKETMKRHGLVKRYIPGGDWIVFATYRNDKKHGLYVQVWAEEVWVRLYKEGKRLEGFVFSRNVKDPDFAIADYQMYGMYGEFESLLRLNAWDFTRLESAFEESME